MDGLSYDDRSQAVILNEEMPIISKVNNEEIGIFNNQRFKIVKIGSFTITIKDDFKNLIKITIPDFQKFFLVGYATTTHSRRECQLVNHLQFMSGIEWTSACDMWPCHDLDELNILVL